MMTRISEFKSSPRPVMINKIGPRDIVITIPKSVKWDDYKKELYAAMNGETLNFKVNAFPKTAAGKRCYICYCGEVIGYHVISGMSEKEFTCTTTGNEWKGKFIERTGHFHMIEPVPMKGFQGFRYYTDDDIFNA